MIYQMFSRKSRSVFPNILKVLVLLLSVSACVGDSEQDDDLTEDAGFSDTGYKESQLAKVDWDQYQGQYQSAAVSVATGMHFPSDSGQIEFERSIAKVVKGSDVNLFVWSWPSGGVTVKYVIGLSLIHI